MSKRKPKERRHRLDLHNTGSLAQIADTDRYVIAARGYAVVDHRPNGGVSHMTYKTLSNAEKAVARIKRESKFDARIWDKTVGDYVE